MNKAEHFVYRLCRRSFLSLWSYMNPRQELFGKELCDVIVVCDPDVIVISVKDIKMPTSGTTDVNNARWKRRAVDGSIAQLYGAQRQLQRMTHVVRNDNSNGVALPPIDRIRVHRIAVAFGSAGSLRTSYGDFGQGFVHIMDESASEVLLNELDTIDDFVEYLIAKEYFLQSGGKLLIEGSEEDLLALYLHNGRVFPSNYEILGIVKGLWNEFRQKPEYKRKVIADRASYTWDGIIETFCHDLLNDRLEFSPGLTQTERAIRAIARENRFSRRILGKGFQEFLDDSLKTRSRQMRSPSGAVYVFLATPLDFPRSSRQAELGNRCFVARGQNPEATTVIGLATEQNAPDNGGFSFDLVHTHKTTWTEQDQTLMNQLQQEFGYFVRPRQTRDSEDEYPLENET